MVSTRQPFACTASIRQPRTISPLTRNVQAPQTPCSQPMCEPVSPSSSRRKSTRCWRGWTLRVTCVPFTVRVTTRVWSMRAREGRRRGAAWWPKSCRGRPFGAGRAFFASSRELGFEQDRRCRHAEESDALLGAAARPRQADDGVVALAARELEEHGFRRFRKLGADQDLARPEVGLEQRLEEAGGRNAPLALLPGDDQHRVERQRARRQLRVRIGEREAAAERAAVADRRMRDMRDRVGDERQVLAHLRRALDLGVGAQRADAHRRRRALRSWKGP